MVIVGPLTLQVKGQLLLFDVLMNWFPEFVWLTGVVPDPPQTVPFGTLVVT